MKLLKIGLLLMLAVLVLLAGCAKREAFRPEPPRPGEALVPADARRLDLVDDLDVESLLTAIDRSLLYYDGSGKNQIFRIADRQVSAAQMKETLIAFREILTSDIPVEQKKDRIAEKFLLLRAAGENGNGSVLFTGYYEPLLEGSLTKTEKYKYPLYRPPPDIVLEKVSPNETRIGRRENGRLVPYYSRREIDVEGVLQGKGLELVWVADPVELNSLHTQGSGKIRLEDGSMLTVSYAQNNGRPFRSVTQNLLDENRLDRSDASYRGFKAWLKDKSEKEIYEILSHNERYIFFRFVDREPVGSLGQPVTPHRSIATDPAYFPQGALAFIRLRKPVLDEDYRVVRRVEFSRFVLNQDKGAAIRGPGRVDLFCGFGPEAQAAAGSLKEKGELFFLVLKPRGRE
ncbi:MAG TPA: MltA domain-containing protein [Smithellaceae bacterium]|nr:MltA domain-containing protein [Smithellaceae bacterium]HRV44041.1 MltA domain-containing protein [Smithellaceae bacterium]